MNTISVTLFYYGVLTCMFQLTVCLVHVYGAWLLLLMHPVYKLGIAQSGCRTIRCKCVQPLSELTETDRLSPSYLWYRHSLG